MTLQILEMLTHLKKDYFKLFLSKHALDLFIGALLLLYFLYKLVTMIVNLFTDSFLGKIVFVMMMNTE